MWPAVLANLLKMLAIQGWNLAWQEPLWGRSAVPLVVVYRVLLREHPQVWLLLARRRTFRRAVS